MGVNIMKAKARVAIATVSGRAYYMLVNELKSRDIPFLSLIPGEPVPPSIKVVITTKDEADRIGHSQILIYNGETEPAKIVDEALRVIMEKNLYEELVIGVDPGKTFGVAILADGKVLKREGGLSMERAIDLILSELVRNPSKVKKVRIGRGVPDLAEEVARRLERALPEGATIEMVNEGGTSTIKDRGFKKKLSDAESAVRIASKE